MLARSAPGMGVRGRPAETLQYCKVSARTSLLQQLVCLGISGFSIGAFLLKFLFWKQFTSTKKKKSPRSFHLCALVNVLPAHLVCLSVPPPPHPSLLRDIVGISSAKHLVSSAGRSSQSQAVCWKSKWDRAVGLWKVIFYGLLKWGTHFFLADKTEGEMCATHSVTVSSLYFWQGGQRSSVAVSTNAPSACHLCFKNVLHLCCAGV